MRPKGSGDHLGCGENAALGRVQAAVEEVLTECSTVILKLPTIGRRHLDNFSGGVDHRVGTKPFGLKQEATTMKRYISHWVRFLSLICYASVLLLVSR